MLNDELRLAKERAAELATEKYIELYDFAPSGYFTLSKEGNIIELNLIGASMLGKESSLLKNSKFSFFVSNDTKPTFTLFLEKTFSSRATETCDVTLLTSGNTPRYIHLTGIFTEKGEQCLVNMVDITELNQATEALKENERKFRMVADNTYDWEYWERVDGRIIYISPSCERMSGYQPEEFLSDSSLLTKIVHPGDANLFKDHTAFINSLQHRREIAEFDFRILKQDGSVVHIGHLCRPVYDDKGNYEGRRISNRDITRRIQVEEELKLESARLFLATRAGGIGTWDYDIENNILVWDDLMYELYGIEKNDFAGMHDSWKTSIHPDDLEWSIAESKKALLGEKEYDTEFRITRPDGSVHNIRALAIVQCDNSGQALRMIGTNWDITELRKTEKEKLNDSENRYLSIFQGSPDGILIADEVTKMIVFANPAQCQLLGYTEEELKTMTIDGIHPKNTFQNTLLEFENAMHGGKTMAVDIQCLRKNGEIFYADIAPSFITINGRKCLVGFFRDTTLRRQVETTLKEALVKAEASNRLKTAFMNNISHEVRTPLNGIMGFGSLLTDPSLTTEERKQYNKFLKASGNRLINTISDYMEISLIASGNVDVILKPVNVRDLLKELQARFQNSCDAKNLVLNLTIPREQEHFTLITDPELLRKIISCLLDNAIKFTSLGSITFGYSVKPGTIDFFVNDTGIGIAPEFHERIFEPFTQEFISDTRGYEGSGLGLSIIKGFLNLLGSDIRLESVKGQGASFFFALPMEPGITSENEAIAPPILHAEIIRPVVLIAEDDLYNDFYMNIILKSLASVVFRAANGKEAVEMCQLHPEISLVLMDLKMPVMDGLEATRQIKSFRKELPVIAITAYAFSRDKKKALEAGCDDFLSKPVSKEELLETFKKFGFL